ncbi:hypothetical protein HCJ66_09250 [Listeria sp. FSL L7-1582]|uniref:hypothetical protein n=1 Tax=Listeria portnoyi TaxID=2713504 RepID=UPI00164DBEB7|nr:hypothetical protein [Listeria portnoyi]MBC6309745.1 hypothetical protein [Listeria portnoyi]
MFTKKKLWIGLGFILVLIIFIAVWSVFKVSSFEYAYENKGAFEQLDALMNTKKYADDIEGVGYKVDSYYLDMNKRVINLIIDKQPEIMVSAPHDEGIDYRIVSNEGGKEKVISIRCNKEMELDVYSAHETGKRNIDIPISKTEANRYLEKSVEATQTMLERVYNGIK